MLTAANALGARLVYGFRSDESYDANAFPVDTVELNTPKFLRNSSVRQVVLALQFKAARRMLESYPVRMFSGAAAPFAAEQKPGARNIYYCHTPPRFLYDQRQLFSGAVEQTLAGKFALSWYQREYEAAIGRMDVIVANSETVKERIRTYLGQDAQVVYPPCDLPSFQWRQQGSYYLSTARLSKLKRVDRIVEAFRRLPDRQLVVASSGEELDTLRKLAADAPNITFLGWVGESEMRKLIGEAIATVYVPVDEDFGMSPVESMAAGKPVIGVAEGGLRETIVDGETGILLPPGFTADDLARAADALTPEKALSMRRACEARAELFSQERFITGISRILGV